ARYRASRMPLPLTALDGKECRTAPKGLQDFGTVLSQLAASLKLMTQSCRRNKEVRLRGTGVNTLARAPRKGSNRTRTGDSDAPAAAVSDRRPTPAQRAW